MSDSVIPVHTRWTFRRKHEVLESINRGKFTRDEFLAANPNMHSDELTEWENNWDGREQSLHWGQRAAFRRENFSKARKRTDA